tara:strand:- start:33 stop:422 length:390 start_codon:yes stop_codon:yes gene_type:complete
MGNIKSKTRCYILDDYNNKHYLNVSNFKVHNEECFIFFSVNRKFFSREIQLFIYKEPKNKNETKNYIIQLGIDLDKNNLTLNKNGKEEYYEYVEFIPDERMRITIRLDLNFKIKMVVFRFESKNLHKIN